MNTEGIDPKTAWQPYVPSDKAPWDLKKAGHLYRRAAFGATWDQLQNALKAGPEKTIADLVRGEQGQEAGIAGACSRQPHLPGREGR